MLDEPATAPDPAAETRPPRRRLQWRPRKALRIPETYDLGKLEAAVNATSQRAVAQWIAFLSLWAYLFFTAVSVTDRDLILLTPVRLPLIGVDLGLVAFFWAAAPLFWIFHLYLVRKVVVLSRDIAYYREQIRTQVCREADREPLYRRMDAFFLTRRLGHAGQGNSLRVLDGLIAAATLAIAPLVLMFTLQIRFLSFHDTDATWWHRGWLLADLALIGFLVGRALRVRRFAERPHALGDAEWRGLLYGLGRTGSAFLSIAVVMFSLFVATVPDEAITRIVRFSDLEARLPRNLNPKDTDFVKDETLGKVQWTLDLRGRDLRNAELSGADLRKVRLDDAKLQNARLTSALLQGASLERVHLEGAILTEAKLQGASLDFASLQGAWLEKAQLQGASIMGANFDGAILVKARLQAVYGNGASFVGGILYESQLQGGVLTWANFEGALLEGAQLQGALLDGAKFIGANLNDVRLWRAAYDEDSEFGVIEFRGESIDAPYSKTEAANHIAEWTRTIPDDEMKASVQKRFDVLLVDSEPQRKFTDKILELRKSGIDYLQQLEKIADLLSDIVCKNGDSVYITRGIIARVSRSSDFVKARFARKLYDLSCAVAAKLPSGERDGLSEWFRPRP